MGRIRTVKPEFPQSESMGRVSRDARLLFVLLWTIADDGGRLRGSSRLLASLLYPYDDDAAGGIESWLTELENERCIVRYQHDGDSYIAVCKWTEHQKIDRPTPSRLPEPPGFDDNSRVLASTREASPPDLGPRTRNGKDQEHIRTPAEAPAWKPLYDAVASCGLEAYTKHGKPSALAGRIAGIIGPHTNNDPNRAADLWRQFWESDEAKYFTDRQPGISIGKWLAHRTAPSANGAVRIVGRY